MLKFEVLWSKIYRKILEFRSIRKILFIFKFTKNAKIVKQTILPDKSSA